MRKFAALVLLLGLYPACTEAQITNRISIPLEYSTGITYSDDAPRRAALALRTGAIFKFCRLGGCQVGVAAATEYDGSSWEPGVGVRAAYRLPFLDIMDAGIYLTGQWLVTGDRQPVSIALIADAPLPPAAFLRVGVIGSFAKGGHNSVGLLIGTDLLRWIRQLTE